jgi:hypothetical protein
LKQRGDTRSTRIVASVDASTAGLTTSSGERLATARPGDDQRSVGAQTIRRARPLGVASGPGDLPSGGEHRRGNALHPPRSRRDT